MAEDMGELLRDAAPRPNRAPDFEQMWSRGRRQRRMTQLAGAAGAVVLLAVGGAGLTQLTPPGPEEVQVIDDPGDGQIVDEPDVNEELWGPGQDFGRAETPDGVPYVGHLRVSEASDRGDGEPAPGQNEVCVSSRVGPQDELSIAQGCGRLEQYLETDRVLWAHSQGPAHATVAAWTPLEIDHAVWELPDQERPIDVLDAPGLPGSVFVIAVDTPPAQDTAIVLYDAEGAQLGQLALETGDSFAEEDLAGPDGNTTAASDRWLTESDRDATQEEHGRGNWVVGYFYPSDADLAGPDFSDRLEPRWLRIDDALELDKQAQLGEALAALAGRPPAGMADAWQASELKLELETAELEDQELVLDFEQLHAPAAGTTQAMAMQAQFENVALHYYPEAETICVLDDGEPAIWLHDMLSCPSRDLPQ